MKKKLTKTGKNVRKKGAKGTRRIRLRIRRWMGKKKRNKVET
jgi:hypothetical protein